MMGLLNRETFLNRLRESRRSSDRGALLILDVDHFKSVNDTYGYPVGDEALIAISKAIVPTMRSSNIVGRIGGEEFAMYLPATDTQAAVVIADRIRTRIEDIEFRPNGRSRHRLTASIGAVTPSF